MIKFSLGCDNEHEFEGWFSNGDEFSRLKETGHLTCPVCASAKVEKLLMAPSVKTTKGKEISIDTQEAPSHESIGEPAGSSIASNPPPAPTVSLPIPAPQSAPVASIPAEIQQEVTHQLRELKKKVMESAENVGDNFGNEARKIHYGESKKRGIYGSSSPEEAAELWEEGIEVIPLPVLPEENN